MKAEDVKVGSKYRVLPNPKLHFSSGKVVDCEAITGGETVTVIKKADRLGDFGVSFDGEGLASFTSAEFLEEIPAEASESERDFLGDWPRAVVSEGKFLLELTEDEVRAVADGNSFLSVREKAKQLLPKRKITIELDEDEVKIIDSAFAGETPDGTLFYPIQSKMYAALNKD